MATEKDDKLLEDYYHNKIDLNTAYKEADDINYIIRTVFWD